LSRVSLADMGVGENGLRKRHATSGQVFGFGQCATSGCFDGACFSDLTIMLMLLEFYERCFAGIAPSLIPNGAGLRRRRCGGVTFSAEGVKGPKGATRRVRSGSWLKAARAGRLESTLRPRQSHGPVPHRMRGTSGGPWLHRYGAMTRGSSRCVKGRRTKQRQGV
jgi:hypothetical protein